MNTRPCVPLLSEPQPLSQTTTINMGKEQRASPPAPPPPTEAEVTAEEEVQARAAQGVPKPLREPPGVLRWFLRTEQGRVQKKKETLDVWQPGKREQMTQRNAETAKERVLQPQYGWIDKPLFLFTLHFLFIYLYDTHAVTLRWWHHLQPGSAQQWPSYGPVRRNFFFQSGRLQITIMCGKIL